MKLGFEDLAVWQQALEFASKVIDLSEALKKERKHYRLFEQLEASSSSIAMNIAEGKGRYSRKEFVHYLYIARGSLYETVTILMIFEKCHWISAECLNGLRNDSIALARMLVGLIKSIKDSGKTLHGKAG